MARRKSLSPYSYDSDWDYYEALEPEPEYEPDDDDLEPDYEE